MTVRNPLPALAILALGAVLAASWAPAARAGRVEYSAKFQSTRVDLSMSPGKEYPVRSIVRNLGSRTWRRDEVQLVAKWTPGPMSPEGGFAAPVPRDIPFNLTATLDGKVTAPAYPGEWELTLQMVHEGKPFGDREKVAITVLTDFKAEISRISIPKTMDVNRNYTASVTVKNTGQSIWPSKRLELVLNVLKPTGSARSRLLGKDRMAYVIAKDLEPNDTYSFRITINPKLEGEYTVELLVWDTEEADEVGKTEKAEVTVR